MNNLREIASLFSFRDTYTLPQKFYLGFGVATTVVVAFLFLIPCMALRGIVWGARAAWAVSGDVAGPFTNVYRTNR